MAEPFLGQIQAFGFNFAPVGWATCDGQLLSIAQNTALFSLLGTMYGGNGQTTFALPDLRGRVAVHQGQGPGLSNYQVGESGGTESVTLIQNQLPLHTHSAAGSSNPADQASPSGVVWAAPVDSTGAGGAGYTQAAPNVTMANGAIGMAGGNQPHPNIQPYLCVNFCIATQGIFPSRS
jgi:microcystin-dependent protein